MIAGMMALAAGCLVTEEHEFLPEVEVPSRISAGDNNLAPGEWIRLPVDGKTLQLKVIVSDPNVEERLFYRVMVENTKSGVPPLRFWEGCEPSPEPESGAEAMGRVERDLSPNGSERRDLTIAIEPMELQEGCYRISLAISSQFDVSCEDAVESPSTYALPETDGDVSLASWGVLRYSDEEDLPRILAECLPLVAGQ